MTGKSLTGPAIAAALVAAIPAAAFSQSGEATVGEGQGSDLIAYPPSYFTEFRPSNAYDMVQKLPGFTFSGGADVRGFAGAAGNVLIDGRRPSSKAISLSDALQRITVAGVERIELIRGGAPGIDMQGMSVLANVVLKTGATNSGVASIGARLYNNHEPGRNGRVSLTRRGRSLTLQGLIAADLSRSEADAGSGYILRRDSAGRDTAFGPIRVTPDSENYRGNGSIEWRGLADVGHLNVGLQTSKAPRREDAALMNPQTGFAFRELLVNQSQTDRGEIGADYEHDFGPIAGTLIGLRTHATTDLTSALTNAGGASLSVSSSAADESIVRATFEGARVFGFDLEFGGEGALNSLDSRSSSGLPSANVRVEEKRGEGFFTAKAKPWPTLSLETGLRVETSTISQSGDASQDATFTFAKPRLIAAYSLTPRTQIRLRVERTVGQLNFRDFAATSDFSVGSLNAGNANLRPENAWVYEATLEQRFWSKGVVLLTYTHQDVTDLIDNIPIPRPGLSPANARGNIDSATRDDLLVNFSVPLDGIGARGWLVRFNGTFSRSNVLDPLTGAAREISDRRPFFGDAHISKDVPSWKSTFGIDAFPVYFTTKTFLINETRTTGETTTFRAYWDWKPRADILLHVQVDAIGTKIKWRERTLYSPTRTSGTPSSFEERRVAQEPSMAIALTKTF